MAPVPTSRKRTVLKRTLLAPVAVLAAIIVVVDDLFRSFVSPAVRWLASLRPVQRLESAVAALPPYPTLALFLIPMAIIWPIKLYGLYLIGLGHWLMGMAAFVVAKVVGIGLAERLFALSRDKLLSIPWFARAYYAVMAVRDRVHDYLKTTRFWPAFVRLVRRLREGLRRVRAGVAVALRRLAPAKLFPGFWARARRARHPSPP
jgi:hypothetical protein